MTTTTTTDRHGPYGYRSWPHPKPRLSDPVDPRMSKVIRRALFTSGRIDSADIAHTADKVAEAVWSWLAEGDPQ